MAQQVIEGVIPPPAPRQTDAVVEAAVLDYIKRHQFVWAADDQEGCAKQIAEHWHGHEDGYQLARALERYEHWDPDMALCEDLDSIGSVVSSWVNNLRKEWATAWNIQPPYPVGTRITKGVITGVNNHNAATYEVQQDAPMWPGSKLLVRFEDAKKVAEGGAA
jgi:hypothetical protein